MDAGFRVSSRSELKYGMLFLSLGTLGYALTNGLSGHTPQKVLLFASLGVGLYLIGETLDSMGPDTADTARTGIYKLLLFGVSVLLMFVTAWFEVPNLGFTTMMAYIWAVHLHGLKIQYGT